MAARRSCPVCDAHTADGDRYCAACGVCLDAPVVLNGGDRPPMTTSEHVRTSGRLSAVLVPVVVLGVLALGAVVLFGGSSGDTDDSANETLADPEPSPSPTAPPTPTATAPPPTPRPTPTAAPAPDDPDAVVDVAALPPLEATHLAVLKGQDIGFLDLATGKWIVRESISRSGPPDMTPWAFDRGIVTTAGSSVLYVPIDGPPVTLREGWVVGATLESVWVRDEGDLRAVELVAVDRDGEIVDQFSPPAMTWVDAVLPTGELVVRGGGRLFIRSTEEIRAVTDGEPYGRLGTQALVQRCSDDLSCTFAIVELRTGASTTLELDVASGDYPQLSREGIVLFGREGASLHRIDGSTVSFVRDLTFEEADGLLWGAVTRVTGPEGVAAIVEDKTLRFEDTEGRVLTQGSIDFFTGFGLASVVFITVPDAS